MEHVRSDTPVYHIWVEARPSLNGAGKNAYCQAVRQAARKEIGTPITAHDIYVEIIYSTAQDSLKRIDTNNVSKPTCDALQGIAYGDDRQVVDCRPKLFDRTANMVVSGDVKSLTRLLDPRHEHVIVKGNRGFSCPVRSGYFADQELAAKADKETIDALSQPIRRSPWS